MELKTFSTTSPDKWQRMRAFINAHSHYSANDLSREYKKIMMTRLCGENILVALLQYIGLAYSTLIAGPTLLWIASGTACGFIFMRGPTIAPGIFFGTYIAFAMETSGSLAALSCALLFTLQASLIFVSSQRFVTPALIFSSLKIFYKFILISGATTALISFILVKLLFTHQQSLIWCNWCLANFLGLIIISFSITAWDMYFPLLQSLKLFNRYALILNYGLLLLTLILLIVSKNPALIIIVSALNFLLLLIISYQYSWCGSLAGVFLQGLMLSFALQFHAYSWITLLYFQAMLTLATLSGAHIAITKMLK